MCGGFVHFSRQMFSRFRSMKITLSLTLTYLSLTILLKLVEQFSSHCLATKSETFHKAVYRSYTWQPSDPDAE